MRKETIFIIDYFQQNAAFMGAIETLPTHEKVQFMKKNLDLDEDTELT